MTRAPALVHVRKPSSLTLARQPALRSPLARDAEPVQPSVFYHRQRHLFANAATVFNSAKQGGSSREKQLEARVAQLEAKLAKKDSVIAEISEDYVKLKKELGEP
jgi:hypothetical protein